VKTTKYSKILLVFMEQFPHKNGSSSASYVLLLKKWPAFKNVSKSLRNVKFKMWFNGGEKKNHLI
jgi:hypothetical protein